MAALEPRMLDDASRAALADLVRRHQSRIRAFLCRFEGDPAVVDELVQDVFISVLPRCAVLAARPEDETARYLRGVARNLARLRWRKLRQERTRADALIRERQGRQLDRDDADPARPVRALKRCLEGLSRSAADLVARHFFQDVPLARIARERSQSDAAVRMLFLRIRRQLRECVEARLRAEPS